MTTYKCTWARYTVVLCTFCSESVVSEDFTGTIKVLRWLSARLWNPRMVSQPPCPCMHTHKCITCASSLTLRRSQQDSCATSAPAPSMVILLVRPKAISLKSPHMRPSYSQANAVAVYVLLNAAVERSYPSSLNSHPLQHRFACCAPFHKSSQPCQVGIPFLPISHIIIAIAGHTLYS